MPLRQHSREIILEKFFLLLAVQEVHACAFSVAALSAGAQSEELAGSCNETVAQAASMPDAEYSFPVERES